jgi:hypothetical protein
VPLLADLPGEVNLLERFLLTDTARLDLDQDIVIAKLYAATSAGAQLDEYRDIEPWATER